MKLERIEIGTKFDLHNLILGGRLRSAPGGLR